MRSKLMTTAALAVLGLALAGAAEAAKPTLPVVQFRSAVVNAKENAGNALLTLTRSKSGTSTDVTVSLGDGSAAGGGDCTGSTGDVDYNDTGFPQVVTFAPWQTTLSVTVPLCNDGFFEGNESFSASLSTNSNGSLGPKSNLRVNVQEDDPEPTIAIADASDAEGQTLDFVVSLTGAHAVPVSVHWTTADGTAVATEDYDADSGDLVWAPGDDGDQHVLVDTHDDSKYANPDQYFTVDLSDAYNGSFDDDQAVGTLEEQDAEPQLSVDDPAAVAEGATVKFTISLDTASDTDVTVAWATSDGTADGDTSCTGSNDYVSGSGTATVTAGSTSTTVDVATCDDGADDGDETFTLDLSSPTDATILDGTGTGTIQDAA